MDPAFLNASGAVFAAIGASLVFAAFAQRSSASSSPARLDLPANPNLVESPGRFTTGRAGGGGPQDRRGDEIRGTPDARPPLGVLARRAARSNGDTQANGADTTAASPLALLGYLAVMTGFFLQFIASLETMRLRDIIQ